ncbi:putative acyltransfersase [Dichotomocladium elegans]|nr:putative acyltransfersase [Dichotomocladium elegans]
MAEDPTPACAAIEYVGYSSELQLPSAIQLIENDLSEPYSIYTYRYFIHNWPSLCFLAMDGQRCVGVIICKLDQHRERKRGYIAMLAVAKEYRKRAIGTTLVQMAIRAMKEQDADEVVLETEYTNLGALALYQRLGFIKDKRLYRYYLNGVDAFRLKLFCKTMVSD